MALCLLGLVHGWWSKQVSNGRFYQGLLALACLSYFLSHLRVHTFVVGCIAGLGAVLFTSGSRRLMRAVSIFLLLLHKMLVLYNQEYYKFLLMLNHLLHHLIQDYRYILKLHVVEKNGMDLP